MPNVALNVLDGGRSLKAVEGVEGPDEFRGAAALEADLRREVESLIAWVMQAAASPKKFLAFEQGLIPRVFALGRLLIALYLARREEAISAELPDRQRVGRWWYRRRPRHGRNLGTFFGELRYYRTYMYLEGKARGVAKGYHPLDRELGLTSDGFSLHVISLAARLATEMSFERVHTWLQRFVGWSPSTEVIENAVLGLGVYTWAFFDSLPRLLLNDGDVLVIMIDQKAIPTATDRELRKRRGERRPNPHPESARHRGRAKRRAAGPKKRRRKGDKSKNGRAATLVVMYTLRASPQDGLLLGPINKVVYGSFAGKRYAFAWARRQADKRGFAPGSNKPIQFVSDGDDDFRVYLEEYFGQYAEHEFIPTLDLPHVMEYLWDAGLARYKEGSDELAAWARDQKTRLLENRVDLVLADLRTMLDSVPKTGPGTKSKRERLTKAIRYIENNLDRMDYQYLRESDLELASGAVEGAVNHVIGLRMDRGGMRWIRERAEALLQLRCIEINGHWDPFIQAVQDAVSSSSRPLRLLRDEPGPLPTLEAVA
jgi:hypothetical protein